MLFRNRDITKLMCYWDLDSGQGETWSKRANGSYCPWKSSLWPGATLMEIIAWSQEESEQVVGAWLMAVSPHLLARAHKDQQSWWNCSWKVLGWFCCARLMALLNAQWCLSCYTNSLSTFNLPVVVLSLKALPFRGGDFYKCNLTTWRGDVNRQRGTVEIHS